MHYTVIFKQSINTCTDTKVNKGWITTKTKNNADETEHWKCETEGHNVEIAYGT